MTDVWSERAEAFRQSAAHREGPDLDLLIEWCEPGDGVQALDVATGGGHVARRLSDAGCDVVSVDPAPGMHPTVVARAEEIPFADASFDVVACRIAAHHFEDVPAAMREMARVSRDRVVVEDNLFTSDEFEEAERLHDPTHVRCYSDQEWRTFFARRASKSKRPRPSSAGSTWRPGWRESRRPRPTLLGPASCSPTGSRTVA